MSAALTQFVTMWGPGLLILIGLFYIARAWMKDRREERKQQLDLLCQFSDRFLSAQDKQAEAMRDVAQTMKDHNQQDVNEHQQILLHLEVLTQMIQELAEKNT